jgi:alkylation response protein AidB-like acyl-CoA dehydrogenase
LLLTPNGDETGIIEAASAFLADAIPISRLHQPGSADLDTAVLRRIAEMGWFGITVPSASGGSGLTSIEHVLFFREVGRCCGPLDILAQSLAAKATPDAALRQALLRGEQCVALAVADSEGIRIFGSREAPCALQIADDGARFLDLRGVTSEERPSLDPATSMRVVRPGAYRATSGCGTPELARLARLAVAAMLLGVAEAALDLIVAYAKIRHTFGRPIGAYQAVRHPCADMALRVEAARCQLWFAAAAMKESRRDLDAHVDAAKHLANEAALSNADVNIQLHGGIGVTDEHDAHLLLKHALLLSRLFGSKRLLLANLLHSRVED